MNTKRVDMLVLFLSLVPNNKKIRRFDRQTSSTFAHLTTCFAVLLFAGRLLVTEWIIGMVAFVGEVLRSDSRIAPTRNVFFSNNP